MKDESCCVDLEKYAKTADFSQELFTVLAQAVKEERESQEEKKQPGIIPAVFNAQNRKAVKNKKS